MTTLMIDNYDSFTWNVYQYISELGADVVVFRNDKVTLEECIALNPRNVVISPGPGHPSAAGISNNVLRHFAGKVPILGVCLGEQCMYELYGGTVKHAGEIVHGKTSPVRHDGKGLYEGVPQGIEATRYHSLAGDPATLPEVLEITSWTESGIVMGVRHKKFVMEGVQYHPESISSEAGKQMFATFLSWEGGVWDELKIRTDLVKWPVDGAEDAGSARHPGAGGNGISIAAIKKLNSTGGKPKSILETIKAQRILDVAHDRSLPGHSADFLARSIALGLAPVVIDFRARLLESATPVAVVAEVKRASPSKGNIDIDAHAPTQALYYAAGGAAAISVLTEPKWFKGNLNDLRQVRAALESVPNRPAVLRKDFVVDSYQILEARLAGADTVLLIVAILTDAELRSLIDFSRDLKMEPLVEVANEPEMRRAVALGAKVIGVNNRDLHTFTVDMNRTSSLAELVPKDTVLVALSGIVGRADVEKYVAGGAKGVLVGEALMRAADKPAFIATLLGSAETEAAAAAPAAPRTMVKICGVTNVEDAVVATKAGADFIGMIFARSARQVSVDTARDIVAAVRAASGASPTSPLLLPQLLAPTTATTPTEWLKSTESLLTTHRTKTGSPLVVGVFVDESPSTINDIIRATKIDIVQFHGHEPASYAPLIAAPVVKVFHVAPGETAGTVAAHIKAAGVKGTVSGVLLDTGAPTGSGGQNGGSGLAFDWGIAVHVAETLPITLAGGLVPGNVADAVKVVRPWCVDVSSGTEGPVKGKKDHGKVREFIEEVRRADAERV
ncbi:indole-3-glycerol phosphate synthase-domain-containing protein [Blyttiomyces helicus]|uniref:Multifunctional tryptophan biosynthesis protein n=1 Tax=Blyttiomyces helicus TaxID=388810 RepID=A0A4P9WMI6_9FUNG|nr:indole-3-glycerol phosphate synthase-domain-containing protein [Blyttiomyces helicus]|eukprot:RKO93435.1 indole-3-glycerol phosphate synthase-domain-containing protein [Blyttiomyces helicus]